MRAVFFVLLAIFNVWSLLSSHTGTKSPSRWASHALLCALGITIYSVAFTLVTINVAVQFLRSASVGKVPLWISLILVFAVVLIGGLAFASRQRSREPHTNTNTVFSVKQARKNSAVERDPLTLTLARRERQSRDAIILRFLLPSGRRLEARPGQFLRFEWFIDGKIVHRSYSICSSPTQSSYIEIMAKRMPNGRVSQFLNDRAAPGLMVRAHGPYGQFYFDQNKHDHMVLIAGGSGITPMMSIIRYLRDLCIASPCTLIYCVRSENDLAFDAELCALAEQMTSLRYVPVVSMAGQDWMGRTGRLQREILEAEIGKPLASTYFLCGPTGFMKLARTLLQAMSVHSSQILQESFGEQVGVRNAGLRN